ncbi:MAG: hypothetical protein ACRD3P_17505 [Terriglobales bacterium]
MISESPVFDGSSRRLASRVWQSMRLPRTSQEKVVAVSTFLVVARYWQYALHPQDANQYGGMWAGGDMILDVFIFCLFLAPTFLLILVIRKSEELYTSYTNALFFLSLTDQISVGFFAIPAVRESNSLIGFACMWRLLGSPFVLRGMAGSRLLAKFPRAMRRSLYAALIERATLGTLIVLLGSGYRGE